MNQLQNSNSPYLRQHASNPVDWCEWSEEALAKAKAENKPLIVSIGYAACHWCHVMAHESFSNETVARYMNQHFVCIKIDREVRPDIDQIYMDAAHLMTGRGGWPLNAVTLPDGRPFFVGTYFPVGQWLDVLTQLHQAYEHNYPKVLAAAQSVTQGLQTSPLAELADNESFTSTHYEQAFKQHIQAIDFKWGGYQKAPKFMMPVGLEFLLQYHYFTDSAQAAEALHVTLMRMAQGGVNDHVGGGFSRYSTDERWLVPHFEKMLYDNAQLVSLYSKAYCHTKNTYFKEIVQKTIAFLEREMHDPNGGFYSSIDADSEHEEGKFYVWTKNEFAKAIGAEDATLMADFFHVTEAGNWEQGKNILHCTQTRESFAEEHGISKTNFTRWYYEAEYKLFVKRNKRVKPGIDNKILCSWNALMLSAYCDAFKATQRTIYMQSAINLAIFLTSNTMQSSGSLQHVYTTEKVSVEAFLDDYALLAQSLIDLYEITLVIHWLEKAHALVEYAELHFLNEKKTMFYYTSDTGENLIARKYELSDNVIPASNSVMADVLLRLDSLLEKPAYKQLAQSMLQHVLVDVQQHGVYYANWAKVLGRFVYPTIDVAVMGENALSTMHQTQQTYLPTSIFSGGMEENLPILKNRLVKNKTLLYVCKDKVCLKPVTNSIAAVYTIREK
ncbi:MAG: hypothetical protein AUK44_07135 [Porphyromonadaceae bacterium CG2_30_38_12]|nr:MAG: hypothetical protein AUK44_07135 [Porphyromonadaceae bacterium CG2_30_38_12]